MCWNSFKVKASQRFSVPLWTQNLLVAVLINNIGPGLCSCFEHHWTQSTHYLETGISQIKRNHSWCYPNWQLSFNMSVRWKLKVMGPLFPGFWTLMWQQDSLDLTRVPNPAAQRSLVGFLLDLHPTGNFPGTREHCGSHCRSSDPQAGTAPGTYGLRGREPEANPWQVRLEGNIRMWGGGGWLGQIAGPRLPFTGHERRMSITLAGERGDRKEAVSICFQLSPGELSVPTTRILGPISSKPLTQGTCS